MNRVSIFTIERRKDFPEAFTKFFADLKTPVITTHGDTTTIFEYMNRCIRFWPHRCGAAGLDEYLKAIGVDITNPQKDSDLLLTLELFINLLHWAPKQDAIDDRNTEFSISFKKNDVKNEAERLIANAEYILEQCCNMAVREVYDEDFTQYHITKRDVEVDAAVEAVPELAEVLLGYYDIRNADDRDYKEKTLIAIYGYLEPKRKAYSGTACSAIIDEFFACMNSFGIRHKTKSQVKIHYTKRNAIYNKMFRMALYVLQSEEVNEFKDELKTLREKK